MNTKVSFLRKRLWLQGGLIGVIVCIILFLFYIFIYFSIIDKTIYAEDIADYRDTPKWTMAVPLVTGHIVPLLSHFYVPYGFLCEFTEPTCTHWSAEYVPGAVPWTLDRRFTFNDMEDHSGYCIEQTMVPTDSCADLSEAVGFWGLVVMLLGIYFAIGAAIGGLIKKSKGK